MITVHKVSKIAPKIQISPGPGRLGLIVSQGQAFVFTARRPVFFIPYPLKKVIFQPRSLKISKLKSERYQSDPIEKCDYNWNKVSLYSPRALRIGKHGEINFRLDAVLSPQNILDKCFRLH